MDFHLLQQSIEALETDLQRSQVILKPVRSLRESLGFDPAGSPLCLTPAGN